MESLKIKSLKGDFFEVSHFSSHLGSTSIGFVTKRRWRKEPDIVESIRFRSDRFMFASKCLLKFGDGFRCRDSKVEYLCGKVVYHGRNRSSSGICFSLGLALEEQAVEDNAQEDSERIDDVDENVLPSNGNENIGDVRVETGQKEEYEEGKNGRIDVRGLAESLQNVQSVEDVDVVLKNIDVLPLQVFSSIIKGFGRDKRVEPAMAIIEWLLKKHRENGDIEGPNVFTYNSLLGAVKQSEQFEKVEVVMNCMKEAGVSPNVVTYNTLMGIYLDQGRELDALKLFEDLHCKGISPSCASYYTALLAYRRLEDGNGALKLYVSLKEKHANGELGNHDGEDWESELVRLKRYTARTCSQVMRQWLVKDENYAINVLKLLIEMDKADLSPSREECERLVWACTRDEHCPVAKELYYRIRERQSDISLSVCNHIIWLLGKAKKWWAALEIYDDLLEKGPKPNSLSHQLIVSHFNVLFGAARRKRIWSWGLKLLNIMEEKGLKPGTKQWNSVLIASSRASETSAAVQIFKKMIEKGEKPSIVSYGALLSALEKGKLYDEAVRVWEHMVQVGVEPNLYAYTIMASVYVGQGKLHLVDHIIKEMGSTGNHPTVVTFNAIISVCAKNGLYDVAYEWFQRMKSMSIEPDEITYEVMIEVLAKDGKPMLAYDMFLRAVKTGLKLRGKAYDAVIQSSETYGTSIDVTALGPRPPEKKSRKTNVLVRSNSSNCANRADGPESEPFCE